MKVPTRLAIAILLGAMAATPAATQVATTNRPGPSSTITADDLANSPRANLLDFVQAQRPMWMNTRGPQGYGPGVMVYLDGTRLGSTAELATLPTAIATEVRHYRGSEAVLRYGPGHADGVIAVTTGRSNRAARPVG